MITKSAEIESVRKINCNFSFKKTVLKFFKRYASLNAQIEKKDPEKLLQEIVTGISRMMDRKMDAIMVCMFYEKLLVFDFYVLLVYSKNG